MVDLDRALSDLVTGPVALGLRVLVVADDPLARVQLAEVLARQPSPVSVDQFAPSLARSPALETLRPDAVLWDFGWDPAHAGIHLGEIAHVTAPLVALVPSESIAREALGAGARGALVRGADGATVYAALAAAARGLHVVDARIASAVLPKRARAVAIDRVEALTPREHEVLQHMAEGLANKAIALKLGISEHTAKFHINAILTKLGAERRTEAVVRAARLGLVML